MSLIKLLSDLFFPRKCPYCSRLLEKDELECAECRSLFPKKPYRKTIPSGNLCVSAFAYNGKVRDALVGYKFYGKRDFYKSLAAALASFFAKEELIADIVSCVPLSKKRKAERGYNQSELIARELAKILGLEYKESLIKLRDNAEQHGLGRELRMKNPQGAYKAIEGLNLDGKTLVLIDDIVTTGYTLSECCRVLSESYDVKIICATAASASEKRSVKQESF